MTDDVFGIVGTVQGGAFRVDECVAEGGFAVVYRAYHDGFRANIALKSLKIPGSLSEGAQKEFLGKFREEAELLFRLSSMIPNIVRPLHVGTLDRADGKFVPFIAIEWLDGRGLDRIIAEKREAAEPAMTVGRMLLLLGPVAEALERAHNFPSQDGTICVVHRDLKPENIFIANLHGHEVPKILDFGIAKVKSAATKVVGHQSLTQEALSAFTPAYGAPEQWFPKSYGQTGPWTDVWGLALTAVECLCGHPPIGDDEDPAAMMGRAIDPLRRPTPRNEGADINDAVEAVFVKALAIDPKDRYHDVATFWTELYAAAGEEASMHAPAGVFHKRPFGSSPSNAEPSSPVASAVPPESPEEKITDPAIATAVKPPRRAMPSLHLVDSEYPPPYTPPRSPAPPIAPYARTVPRVPAASGTPWSLVLAVGGGVFAVGGLFFGRELLSSHKDSAAMTAPTPSMSASAGAYALEGGRVAELLGRAEERLVFGDLEGAKEQLDRAAALADKNPVVLSGLARIEAIRADVHWLGERLAAADDAAAKGAEHKKLDERLPKVASTVATAERTNPTEPSVLRARVDALRIAGDLKKADELSTQIAWETTNPETAYVLAALDMAEPSPPWNLVIERLRRASSNERGPGRARAALIYALARSGDIEGARRELARFSRGDPHPLEKPLQAFLERLSPTQDGGSAEATGTDKELRKLLDDASKAKEQTDLSRAESLYQKVNHTDPKNAEALTGLADIARKRGQAANAARYYDAALESDPDYMPAIMGRADQKWMLGDRKGASTLYRRASKIAADNSPDKQRALTRLNEFDSEHVSSSSSGSTTGWHQLPPGVDTSDL